MIAVDHLTVRVGAFALENVGFDVPTGQYAVLMGRTGAGKTTLLEALCGLKAVAGGTIRLNGRDVTRLRPAERGIGYVPQDRALFQTMTVREHLAFALTVQKAGRQVIQQSVAELSRLLGIEHLLDRRPPGLSGSWTLPTTAFSSPSLTNRRSLTKESGGSAAKRKASS